MDRAPSIRSYVRREGRMTRAQRYALQAYAYRYGVQAEGRLDLSLLFGRRAPCYAEIGFGMGDALLELARTNRDRDYLGIEVYAPGIGRLMAHLEQEGLSNVRVARGDAVEVLASVVPESSLAGVYLFFPDPWPKKRHHKRRLVQPPFVQLLASKLSARGELQLATDWEHYARQMLEVVEGSGRFLNLAGPGRFSDRSPARPVTKFETRGLRLGHPVWDLRFERDGGR